MLFQASMPPAFQIEALDTLVHAVCCSPSSATTNKVPATKLYQKSSLYSPLYVWLPMFSEFDRYKE